MSLRDKLQEDLKVALKEGNIPRRSAIRLVLSAINYADIEKGALVDDGAVLGIIAKEARQHRESIEAFTKGKRADLLEKERAELTVLEGYLPRQMTREELVEAASKVIAEVGAQGPGDRGKIMQRLMNELKGRADGREVNEVVTELLSKGG
jgi:uncharacterized protein YqeY